MNQINWTAEEAQTVLQNIIKRTTHDPDFRKLVLENPAAAVQEIAKKSLPEAFVINVVENDGADLTIVLPDAAVPSELSDQQLEGVAGGILKPADHPLKGMEPPPCVITAGDL